MSDNEYRHVEFGGAESYGAVSRADGAADRGSRARLIGFSLLFTLLTIVAMAWTRKQSPISVYQLRSQKNWTDFEGEDSEEAYIAGEKNILDLFLKDSEQENTVSNSGCQTHAQQSDCLRADRGQGVRCSPSASCATIGNRIGDTFPGGGSTSGERASKPKGTLVTKLSWPPRQTGRL